MATFDTLRASQRLRDEGGFGEQQAQAIAGVLAEDVVPHLVSKDDLDRFEARLLGRLDQMDGRFEQIAGRFEQLDGRFEQLDGRFEQLEERLKHYVNVRVGAMIATATALILTALAIATAVIAST